MFYNLQYEIEYHLFIFNVLSSTEYEYTDLLKQFPTNS